MIFLESTSKYLGIWQDRVDVAIKQPHRIAISSGGDARSFQKRKDDFFKEIYDSVYRYTFYVEEYLVPEFEQLKGKGQIEKI